MMICLSHQSIIDMMEAACDGHDEEVLEWMDTLMPRLTISMEVRHLQIVCASHQERSLPHILHTTFIIVVYSEEGDNYMAFLAGHAICSRLPRSMPPALSNDTVTCADISAL